MTVQHLNRRQSSPPSASTQAHTILQSPGVLGWRREVEPSQVSSGGGEHAGAAWFTVFVAKDLRGMPSAHPLGTYCRPSGAKGYGREAWAGAKETE